MQSHQLGHVFFRFITLKRQKKQNKPTKQPNFHANKTSSLETASFQDNG